jgi:hypothetical protein
MQCPVCKSRKGYFKLYSQKNGQARFRTLICKKNACLITSVEEYPEPFSPAIKYKVKESFASLHARHRTYWVDRATRQTFDTEERFENAIPQHTSKDYRHS